MHFSELGLLLLLALVIGAFWSIHSTRLLNKTFIGMTVGSLLVLFLALRLLMVGYSWQLLPVLLLTLIIVIGLTLIPKLSPVIRRWATAGLTLIWAMALAPLILFPIPSLPEPGGDYAVGTTSLHLVDENRTEIYGRNAGKAREFMVQLWYPSESDETHPKAQYLPDAKASAPAIATRLGLPSFILNHTNLIQVHSRAEAPVSSRQPNYPLLVFSHGYQSLRGQTTPLMEELASHGYIVAAMEHTFGAAVTIFPDGRIEFLDPDTLSGEGAAYDASARKLGQQWQNDIDYLLTTLSKLTSDSDQGGLLAGAIDLSNLGMFGHSTGAGVVTKACQSRACKAVLGLDAWFGPMPDDGLSVGADQPTLFLMSEIWPKPKNVRRIAEFMQNSAQANWLTILGTAHYDFSDLPLLSPLTYQLGLSGPIDSRRGQQIVSQITLAFFDHHLIDPTAHAFNALDLNFDEVIEATPSSLLNR